MTFDHVDLNHGGNITYSLRRWANRRKPFLSIIHIAFFGDYRHGSAGAPDAYYIASMVNAAHQVWYPSAIVLDLGEICYKWGDNMDAVLTVPTDIFAIVVSPKCEPAISTLTFGMRTDKSVLNEPGYFDSLDSALRHVTQALVGDWNSKVEKDGNWFTSADLITVEELEQSS
jgi:hypothetical protein